MRNWIAGNLKANSQVYVFLTTFVLCGIIFVLYLFFSKKEIIPQTITRLENVISSVSSSFDEKDISPEISLIFTGDVILARSVNFISHSKKDFTWAFKNVAKYISDADLTVINLESPLIENCPLTNEGFIFCGSKNHVSGISLAGVDVVGFANNHAGDYGTNGLTETANNLAEIGVSVYGTSDFPIHYKQVKDTKFSFVGFNDIGVSKGNILQASEENIKKYIEIARNNSDFVVVSFHWGDEYVSQPNKRQVELGRLAIDLGADLVVGNHPHWIQGYEVYQDKYIFYALGNFIFDQEWSQKTKEGFFIKTIVQDRKIKNISMYPIEIRNYGEVFVTDNIKILPTKFY